MRECPVDVEDIPLAALRTRDGLRYLTWARLCRSLEAAPGRPCGVEGHRLHPALAGLDFACVGGGRVVGMLVHAGPTVPAYDARQLRRWGQLCSRILLVTGDDLPAARCLAAIPAEWGLYRLAGRGLRLERPARDLRGPTPESVIATMGRSEMTSAALHLGMGDRGFSDLTQEEMAAVLGTASAEALTEALREVLLGRRARRAAGEARARPGREREQQDDAEDAAPEDTPGTCPRCGSENRALRGAVTTHGLNGWKVYCGTCRHSGAARGSREAAIEAWNREERPWTPYLRVGTFGWMRVAPPLSEADLSGTFWEG